MGANIEVDEGTATIKPSTLHGAEVYASDLRAGACLIIAGLIAEGVTTIYNVKHIYRGYTDIIEHLKALVQIFGRKLYRFILFCGIIIILIKKGVRLHSKFIDER